MKKNGSVIAAGTSSYKTISEDGPRKYFAIDNNQAYIGDAQWTTTLSGTVPTTESEMATDMNIRLPYYDVFCGLDPVNANKNKTSSIGRTMVGINSSEPGIVYILVAKSLKQITAISQLMILVNHLTDQTIISKDTFEKLIILVAPFAPHLAEELWEQLGNKYSVFTTTVWPRYDESYLVSDTVKIWVQFNGKIRWDIEINKETTQEDVMQIVKSDPKLSTHLAWEPKKIIYIPWKILNIVI